jgi:DNA-directed RNA polymerase subunit RPC12/RpoP
MKDVSVDGQGNLRCPSCGSSNFDLARTGKAKVSGFLTIGVGVMLLPKRMKCLQCGKWATSGDAKPLPKTRAASSSPAPVIRPATKWVKFTCLKCNTRHSTAQDSTQFRCGRCQGVTRWVVCPGCKKTVQVLEEWDAVHCRVCGTDFATQWTSDSAQTIQTDAPGASPGPEGLDAPSGEEAKDAKSDGADFVGSLERLVSLREAGGITSEEFDQAKRKLLGT